MPYDPEFKRRFDILRQTGYMKAYEEMTKAMCAPFWWSSKLPVEREARVAANGTVCFINTGVRHLGVTADHVYRGFLKAKQELPDVDCQFGGNTFDPERHYIDSSPEDELDLATFEVSEVFVNSSFGHYHHNAIKWPPQPVRQGEAVMYGGYPQILRKPRTREVDFYRQYFISRVTDVDDKRGLILDPQPENMYWPAHEGEPINMKWEGHSGGPVYRVIDAKLDGELVDRVEVVGFIYQTIMDVMLCRPSSFINPDGTIRR